MPDQQENLLEGIWQVLQKALYSFSPALKEAGKSCAGVFCIAMLLCIFQLLTTKDATSAIQMLAMVTISLMLLTTSSSLILQAGETATEMSEYAKLLLPVMTAGMSAQGCVTSSAALYAGSSVFIALLSSLISKYLAPMVNVYLAVAATSAVIQNDLLYGICKTLKSVVTWLLKMLLYVFTGFITVTGVISGSADALTVKAAKLTISGMVPVVGSILSDASETIILGAGIMKNSVGIYGLFAVVAICVLPFLNIGAQYLMLKLTSMGCSAFSKPCSVLIQDFASAMGLLLGMIGTLCIMLMLGIVCFIKGVG
jgi:stage III sporulation protein AE